MQTITQIYTNYKQKCLKNNIKPFSISLFRKKVENQAQIINLNKKIFDADFDAYTYLIDNKLHFRLSNSKLGKGKPHKRMTKSYIAKKLKVTRQSLAEKCKVIIELKKIVENCLKIGKLDTKNLGLINFFMKMNKQTYLGYKLGKLENYDKKTKNSKSDC